MDLRIIFIKFGLKDFCMLSISNAFLRFGHREIFSHISLTLPSKSWTSILGTTGCGKSSLLKLLTGIIPQSNKASFTANQTDLHQKVAYMAQSDVLMPWLNTLENIFLGHTLSLRSITAEDKDKAHLLLKKVGLLEYAHAYPKDLSGGMRQRVALVRTLIQNRPIIFMDEPFSALDAITRYEMQELAHACLQDKTVLLITHDPLEALRLSHQVLVMTQHKTLQKFTLPSSKPLRDADDPELFYKQKELLSLLRENPTYAT